MKLFSNTVLLISGLVSILCSSLAFSSVKDAEIGLHANLGVNEQNESSSAIFHAAFSSRYLFIFDKWAVGPLLNGGYISNHYRFGFGVEVKHYYGDINSDTLVPFTSLSISHDINEVNSENSYNTTSGKLSAGLISFINENVALSPQINHQRAISKIKGYQAHDNTTSLGLGLTILI